MMSPFLRQRKTYTPRFPKALDSIQSIVPEPLQSVEPDVSEDQRVKLRKVFKHTYGQPIVRLLNVSSKKAPEFPQRIGVVLSGGQAPGGHNVIAGLFDGLKSISEDCMLVGFLGGPSGIIHDKTLELTPPVIDDFRNTGGFDMLGSGRTKIESESDFQKSLEVCKKHELTGLVVIGGDDSNTNAALLGEYFREHNSNCVVIGVPKTIDGDLKNQYVETSFGFDTAVRVYSELISNLCRDAVSAKKYYHFIRLMGRSASHITLEAALQTRPNVALIGEEIAAENKTLKDITIDIANVVKERHNMGKEYGIILIPEGIVEFVPEMKHLIAELNHLLASEAKTFERHDSIPSKIRFVLDKMDKTARATFETLPQSIREQLLEDRDPHGNVQVSRIETEKLISEMVEEYLKVEKSVGRFSGKFSRLCHFFGYEGRCAAPTNFDADYAYALGRTAVALVQSGVTGYMSVVRNLGLERGQWESMGVPLTMMMNIENRHGKDKPVIAKSLVKLDGAPFKRFKEKRESWAREDAYRFSGAIQYFGPPEVTDQVAATLALEIGSPSAGAYEL